jgi:hypothetical protein
VANEPVVDLRADIRKSQKLKSEEAKAKVQTGNLRNRELSVSFFEKLIALDAGSIAVTVSIGIALIGKSQSHAATHTYLSWLTAIASLFWVSLVCAVGHNYMFVKVSELEIVHETAMSNYLALISSHADLCAVGSMELAGIISDAIVASLSDRIKVATARAIRISRRLHRISRVGSIAIGAFLFAYSLILIAVIRIWWATR